MFHITMQQRTEKGHTRRFKLRYNVSWIFVHRKRTSIVLIKKHCSDITKELNAVFSPHSLKDVNVSC